MVVRTRASFIFQWPNGCKNKSLVQYLPSMSEMNIASNIVQSIRWKSFIILRPFYHFKWLINKLDARSTIGRVARNNYKPVGLTKSRKLIGILDLKAKLAPLLKSSIWSVCYLAVNPASQMYWVIWVVLPEPVSPTTIKTWREKIMTSRSVEW